MNEDEIARIVFSRWNDEVTVPPLDSFLERRQKSIPSYGWTYPVAAAVFALLLIAGLQTIRETGQSSQSMSDWESPTDFLLK